MSISAEYAEEHKSSPAVLCCRAEEGVVLSSHNLEDPEIFDDLVDQGLLKLDGCLTIGDVLEPKKDVTNDEMLWGAVSERRSRDVRMGAKSGREKPFRKVKKRMKNFLT